MKCVHERMDEENGKKIYNNNNNKAAKPKPKTFWITHHDCC